MRSATSADISKAWWWCGIMSVMKRTSTGAKLVLAISIARAALSSRDGSPGAPGWMIGGSSCPATSVAHVSRETAR